MKRLGLYARLIKPMKENHWLCLCYCSCKTMFENNVLYSHSNGIDLTIEGAAERDTIQKAPKIRGALMSPLLTYVVKKPHISPKFRF